LLEFCLAECLYIYLIKVLRRACDRADLLNGLNKHIQNKWWQPSTKTRDAALPSLHLWGT